MARYPTLLDLTQALAPDGSIAAIGEILNQTNELLADMTFVEGNLPTGHRSAIRTGLPGYTWRRLYGFVQPDKATQAQVTDSCGMMEAYNQVDAALADLSGNPQEYRAQQARAQLESMSQGMAETVIYGNSSTNPEQFDGLAPRYSSLSAGNADNIVTGGGVGSDNGSIWLVGWSPTTVYGIYPKGSQAGLRMQDKGQITNQGVDGNDVGGLQEVYRTHFRWDCGLVVEDWRYVVRIANIARSNLSADLTTGADLTDLMYDAIERLPMVTPNTAFYADRTMRKFIEKQTATKIKASTLTKEDVGGVRSATFDGIPIRRLDRLAVNEATIS